MIAGFKGFVTIRLSLCSHFKLKRFITQPKYLYDLRRTTECECRKVTPESTEICEDKLYNTSKRKIYISF